MISRVQVVNDFEVVIHLDYAFAPFLGHLAHTASSIVSRRAVTEMGDTAHALSPVGSGPYRITNIVTGDRVELTRWDGYHGTPARVRDIVYRNIPDAATRLLELETGGADVLIELNLSPHDVPRAEAHPNIQVLRDMNLSMTYIGFNVINPPLNDVRLRRAIIYALDLDAINNVAYVGLGSTGTAPINGRVWASAAGRLPEYEFNPARARQLLAEAGFPNGFDTTIWVNEGNMARLDTAEMMQAMLAQVNIRADVQIVEWGTYLDLTSRRDGGHHMFILGWVTVTGDPDYGLFPLFHSESHGAAGNRMFYTNAEVDQLLDLGRTETDPVRREEIYFRVQQIVHDEAPWISQWFGETVHGLGPNVRGFRLHPTGTDRWQTVFFAE
jgi:peptide/nickel transport system substrate-binding protein